MFLIHKCILITNGGEVWASEMEEKETANMSSCFLLVIHILHHEHSTKHSRALLYYSIRKVIKIIK